MVMCFSGVVLRGLCGDFGFGIGYEFGVLLTVLLDCVSVWCCWLVSIGGNVLWAYCVAGLLCTGFGCPVGFCCRLVCYGAIL